MKRSHTDVNSVVLCFITFLITTFNIYAFYMNHNTFLKPLNQIKTVDYDLLFSKSARQNVMNSRYELREPHHPVGLLNVSNCCYLNSLLQCYFLMNDFTAALLEAEPLSDLEKSLGSESQTKIKRIKSEYELLRRFKNFFSQMALTSKRYLDPSVVLANLVDSVGEKVSYGEEKDLSEINILIIERLSQAMTYSKKHYKHPSKLIEEEGLSKDINASLIELQPQNGKNQEGSKKNTYSSIFNPSKGDIKRLFYGTKAQYYEQRQEGQQEQGPVVSDFAGIIISPRSGSLQHALDEQFRFKVQINGRQVNKRIYIREEPKYLFLYINRTDFDKEQGQALKNQHQFSFDFTIYLDRFFERYRNVESGRDEKVRELLGLKSRLKEQMNALQMLFKKLEECYKYARQLEGWEEKLPKEEDCQEQYAILEQRLQAVQMQLRKVQSREQEYHLMYIFVHRGDAVSGHYWGYGRNDDTWYRFDINCRPLPREQIIVDMQKSSGTPYGLLYVRKQDLAKFQYKHHLYKPVPQELSADDFRNFLSEAISQDIIRQNATMHQEVQRRNQQLIKNKACTDYKARCSVMKKLWNNYEVNGPVRLNNIEIGNNFSVFLWWKKQYELAKFSLFQQAILTATSNKMTIAKLMNEHELLHRVQHKFKKVCKGEAILRNYALVGKDLERYLQLHQQYQVVNMEMVWGLVTMVKCNNFISEWASDDQLPRKEFSQKQLSYLSTLISIMKMRHAIQKSQRYRKQIQKLEKPLYITQVNHEIMNLTLLRLVVSGVKFGSLQAYIDLQDCVAEQIIKINAGNRFEIPGEANKVQSCSDPVAQISDLVRQYYHPNPKKSAQTSSSVKKNNSKDRASSSQRSLGSPIKSASMSQKQAASDIDEFLTVASDKTPIVFNQKEVWRAQDIDRQKPNNDFANKLMAFLKKMGPILPLYKKVLTEGRAFSEEQLKGQGIILDRDQQILIPESKPQQESLI